MGPSRFALLLLAATWTSPPLSGSTVTRSTSTPSHQAAVQPQSNAATLAAALADADGAEARERVLAQHPSIGLPALFEALFERGARHRIQAEPVIAERSFAAALELAQQRNLQPYACRAVEGLGTVAFERGDYPEARGHFDRALEIAETLQSAELIASTLNHRAAVRFRQGDLSGALIDAQRALATGEPLGIPALTAASLNGIGMVLRNQGHTDDALAHYERALPLAEAGTDRVLLARLLNNLGVAENVRGNHERTLEYYARSLAVSEQAGFRWGVAQVLSNIGNVYVGLGDNARALEFLQRSAHASEAIGERRTATFTLLMIGQVHRAQGRDDLALEFYERGRTQAEAIGERTFTALATRYAGGVHLARRDFASARQALEASLEQYQAIGNREGIGDALQSLSALHEAEGNLDAALDFARKSLATRDREQDRRTWPMAWQRLASLQLARGEYDAALTSAGEALESATATGYPPRIWPAQLAAGRALRALGRRDEARQMLADAIATIESLRTRTAGGETELQRSFERHVAAYHELCELLLEEGRTVEALAYAERARARVLLDVLRGGRVRITGAMTPAEQQRERDIDAAVAALTGELERERSRSRPNAAAIAAVESRLEKARLEADAFRAQLYAAHPELRVHRGEAAAVAPSELASVIPDRHTAVLEYLVTGRATFLFVLTRDEAGAEPIVTVHELDLPAAALEEKISGFRERLATRDLAVRGPARALHELLIAPARERLRAKRAIVVVPDGPLWDLPFAALLGPAGRFLLQDHTISMVSSLTVWREIQQRRSLPASPATSVLALGNPAVPQVAVRGDAVRGHGLAPLPAAEREARRVAAVYGAGRSVMLTGSAAREDRLKDEAAKHSVLHLATHGVLDNTSPLYSHLVLAPGASDREDDGRLTAREILRLSLQAELVVLSACETARGRVSAGEGMIGLTWALFIAGVPTTVVSQWRVDSDSTAELMVRFHRRLAGNASRPASSSAEALRASALALLATERYRHPFYWAGFVVVGDGLRSPKGGRVE